MGKVPYADMLGERDALAVIAETPARLAKVFAGLSDEELNKRPAPGKWSLREIMVHLADCEIAWSWRLRYAFEKERAAMQPFDQEVWSKVYDRYTFAQAKAMFEALRVWNVVFVGGLSETDKRKVIEHPERGEEELWDLVRIMAGHDLHHLRSLEKSSAH
jgi:uncharacterized damage-inducible protein DinB